MPNPLLLPTELNRVKHQNSLVLKIKLSHSAFTYSLAITFRTFITRISFRTPFNLPTELNRLSIRLSSFKDKVLTLCFYIFTCFCFSHVYHTYFVPKTSPPPTELNRIEHQKSLVLKQNCHTLLLNIHLPLLFVPLSHIFRAEPPLPPN